MKRVYRARLTTIAMVVTVLLLVVGASACSSGNDETVDLLKDPKFGLAHINDEFHTIKGEDLLASPTFGLAHLNDEFHTINGTLADPQVGLAHINDELHPLKQVLADFSEQVRSLQ